MKPGAILGEHGRGPTVDNAALYRALTQGTLRSGRRPRRPGGKNRRSGAHWYTGRQPALALAECHNHAPRGYYFEEFRSGAARVTGSHASREGP